MAKWEQKRSFWTWGYESDEPTDEQRRGVAKAISARTGVAVEPPAIPKLDDVAVRAPRLDVPSNLAGWVSTENEDRLLHTYGGHFMELLAAMRGQFDNPPDAVAHPRSEDELEATLAWADAAGHKVVPYGGGTSVVWGVRPPDAESVVTIDLDHLGGVVEIDHTSRAARVRAGMLGPDLEDVLRPQGLTLRHFPQSFPWSTVGGWVATRAGGHYATNQTHIDDMVESVRMITPSGWWESRRLPGSGAGPSPDRMVIGSEGTLGIISECWLRLQKRPVYRATAGIVFPSWATGAEAVRLIVQSKLWPSNLRLLDPAEAKQSAGLDGKQALLIVGFESADIPQGTNIHAAVALAREAGGVIDDDQIRVDDGRGKATGREGAVGAWRDSFIGVNAGLTNGLGLIVDTFETAITWDRFAEFDGHVREKVGSTLERVLGTGWTLSCRFTHVYTDGPAPYYTLMGPGKIGGELEQWQEIKAAATEAVVEAGGTVTHHHSVGRMHRPGYDQQRPDLFAKAFKAAKQSLDPRATLNPGVLFDVD